MYKYISGVLAIIFAVGLAAFTKPDRPKAGLPDYYFEFDIANHAATQTNVQTPGFWMSVSDLNGCSQDDERACRIEVPQSAVNLTSPVTLKSDAVINTAQFGSTSYVVLGGSVSDLRNTKN